MTVGVVDVTGRRVEVMRRGEGAPVVYLHGLADVHSLVEPGSSTPLVDHLAGARAVVAPALPGYGESDALEPLADLEDHAFALVDLLDELGLDHVGVVASCFGGWMAAELALRHPHRVSHLVLVAPLGLHVRGEPGAAFFGAAAPRGIGGFGEVRAVLFAEPDGAVATDALPDDLDHNRALRWFGGLAAAASLGWRAPQLCDRRLGARLHRVRVPTLLVWGSLDRLTPTAHARAWLGAMPAARLEVLEDVGHCAHLEAPDRVADLALAFLAE